MSATRHVLIQITFIALGALAFGLGLSGCRSGATSAHENDRHIHPIVTRAADYLTGVFSSYEQSIEDPEYFHIRLVCKRIWECRSDGV